MPETLSGLAFLDDMGEIPTANIPASVTDGIAGATADATTALGQIAALATVATTGAAANVSGLATVATTGSASDLGSGTLPAARLPALTPLQQIAMGIMGASYTTAALNLLSTSAGNVCIPACAGYVFQPVSIRVSVRTRTGTTTGTLAYQVGNNVNEDNLASGTTSGAALTAQTAPYNSAPTTSNLNTAGLAAATTGYTMKITGAATGSSVLTGYITLVGIWVPA